MQATHSRSEVELKGVGEAGKGRAGRGPQEGREERGKGVREGKMGQASMNANVLASANCTHKRQQIQDACHMFFRCYAYQSKPWHQRPSSR